MAESAGASGAQPPPQQPAHLVAKPSASICSMRASMRA
jgi:hypothetical protein